MVNTSQNAEPRVRYTVTVEIERPVRYDNDAPLSEQIEWCLSNAAKSDIVRELQGAILSARFSSRAVDGDIRYDVQAAEIVGESR